MRYSIIAVVSVGGQLTSLSLAFLFHFLMARMLGLALYGDFGVLLAVFTIIFLPIVSLQAILMRETAKLHAQGKEANMHWLITHYFKQSLLFGLLLASIAFIILFLSGILIHPLETSLILLSIPLFYGIYIYNSYFMGKQQPFHFVTILVLADFLRLLFALILVSVGLNLLGIGVSYIATALILSAAIFFLFFRNQQPLAKRFSFSLKQHLVLVFPTYALLSVFLVIDLFFARYILTSESAGIYNAALTLARGVFYASLGMMNAFLPQSSKLSIKHDWKKILHSLLISAGILLLLTIGIFLLKDLLIGILYGNAYLPASSLLGILAFSMFFLSLSLLFTNLMWSQHEQKTPLIVAAMVVAIALVLFYYLTSSLGIIGTAYASLTSTLLLALLQGAAALNILRK